MNRPIRFVHPVLARNLTRFARCERGAVTVDWVPFTGAAIALGLVVTYNVSLGSSDLGETTAETLAASEVAAIIHQPRTPAKDDGGFDQPPANWDDGLGPLPGGGYTGYPGDDYASLPPLDFGPPGDDGGAGAAPGNSGNAPGNSGNDGSAGGCQGVPGVSCSGLGDGTNPGQGSGNNNAGDTPGGQGVHNPGGLNQSGDNPSDSAVPAHVNHTFPTREIPSDWGNWRDTTDWIGLQHITNGQPAAFEVWGDGNPAFNLDGVEQTSGTLHWGAQITMDTPPAPGTSHTAYIQVTTATETWVASYTITRAGTAPAPAPAPAQAPAATYTQTVNIPYNWNSTFQDWFTRPAHIPAEEWNNAPYTVTGDGNPVAHSNSGGWKAEGTMRWNGVSLRFDTPAPGQTHTILVQFGDHVGAYTFTRASAP